MAETIISPNVCTFSDEKLETLNIQIELPGVSKKDIEMRLFEDGFYIVARKEGIKYMGSYALICPVQPEKAIAEYANGLLTVNVPYKEPLEKGAKVKID
jgi:HSP20 family molecular chaperone IbpA